MFYGCVVLRTVLLNFPYRVQALTLIKPRPCSNEQMVTKWWLERVEMRKDVVQKQKYFE
jgi:hypothetical protein